MDMEQVTFEERISKTLFVSKGFFRMNKGGKHWYRKMSVSTRILNQAFIIIFVPQNKTLLRERRI